MSNSKRNFYEILNATSTASFNQLKSNYKQLILQCHPDKIMQQQLKQEKHNVQQIQDDPINFEFVAITEAWNCLKDPVKRKQYDAELLLKKFHTHNNIYAHIKLSEMKKQPNTTGDYYQEEGDDDKLVLRVAGNVQQEEITKYLYTYDCRCGGQYIVDDESAEEYCRSANNRHTQINNSNNNAVVDDDYDDDDDDADSTTQNNKISSNHMKYKENNGGGASGAGGSEGVVQNNTDDDNDDVDGEGEGGGDLVVECSECSLVIILNG